MSSMASDMGTVNRAMGMKAAALAMMLAMVVGCSSGNDSSSTSVASGVGVAGYVQAPNGALAKVPMTAKQWFASLFTVAESFAIDIVGWSGVPSATVRAFQIDEDGVPTGLVIATGSTNPDGSFNLTLPTGTQFASNLIAQAENQVGITGPMPVGAANTLSVPIVSSTVNMNPATDAATQMLVNRTTEPLANFTPTEVAQYLSVVETLVTENPPGSANLATTIASITAAFSSQMAAALTVLSGTGVAVPAIITTSLPNGINGSLYSRTALAVGGVGTLVWSLDSGSGLLPAGLALNANTGRISGTPTTPVTANFTLRVQDATSPTPQEDTQALSLTITPATPLSIATPSPLAAGTEGLAYNLLLTANGGTPGYAWSFAAGSSLLPNGLSLNSTGLISGTPTVAGTVAITVQVRDAASVSVTQQLSLTINPSGPSPLTITSTSPLAAGTVNQPYSVTLTASGGTQPFTWSVADGYPLPSFLTLNASTGQISGTPPVAAGYRLTIQVRDSSNPQQSREGAFDLSVQALCDTGFGSATVDGAPNTVEGRFCPQTNVIQGVPNADGNVYVSWGETSLGVYENILVQYNLASGQPVSVSFHLNDPLRLWTYICGPTATASYPACSGVTLNTSTGTVSFINTVVGSGTSPVFTLNGVLTY